MPDMNIGDTITARWSFERSREGAPAKATESHQKATGRVTKIEGGKITLNCDGPEVVVERAWVTE